MPLVIDLGGVAYNSRRNLLAAVSLQGKIAYHLWKIGYSGQKNKSDVTLLKKEKWHPHYGTDGCNRLINFSLYQIHVSCLH